MAYTGWESEPVAEIRTRISTLNSNMQEFDRLVSRTKEASNYKFDLTSFYLAAREKIFALNSDLDNLKKFLKDNRTAIAQTENVDYYDLEIQHFIAHINGLSEFITAPGGSLSPTTAMVPSFIKGKPATSQTVASNAKEDPSWEGVCTGVADGDTVWVSYPGGADRFVRLAGNDAPEGGTERGKVATQYMTDLILGKKVRVNVDYNTPFELYGRWLGVIMLHQDDGTDLNVNIQMLRSCNANILNKFGKHHYVDDDEMKLAHGACIMGWPLVGNVKIYSNPAGAAIYVDGYDTGIKTPGVVQVPVGTHRFTLVAYGCSSLSDDLTVENAEVVPPVYHLAKLPAAGGTVIILTDPPELNATVLQDNVVIGTTPLIMDVPLDKPANLTLQADGYNDVMQVASASLGVVVRYYVAMTEVAGTSETAAPAAATPVPTPTGPVVGGTAPVSTVLTNAMPETGSVGAGGVDTGVYITENAGKSKMIKAAKKATSAKKVKQASMLSAATGK
jgi:endonuclease YncB( thermonuclease family)